MPLLVLLHWFGGTGDGVEAEYQLEPLAQQRQFLYVRPDATLDSQGNRSWNATDACCHWSPYVDDAGYLDSIVDEVTSDFNVDAKRVYLFGISNGGFMAYRMACDYADQIAAMVSIVGATVMDASECTPSEPVSVLEVHGTADELVPYGGGEFLAGHPFPGTERTVADWARLNGCDEERVPTGERMDVDTTLNGRETVVSAFNACAAGTDVELWTVEGGSHELRISADFVPAAVEFLLNHTKP